MFVNTVQDDDLIGEYVSSRFDQREQIHFLQKEKDF